MTIRTEFDAVSLKTLFESSGQDFTVIVKRWARAYVPLVGGTESINGQTNLGDGGIDGYLTFPDTWQCPFGFKLAESCVVQLKAGEFVKSVAEEELTKKAAEGTYRIRDDIEGGKQVLWFVGKALADGDLTNAETDLNAIIDKINPDAPNGLIIDLNRLAELLSVTPVIAIEHFHPNFGCVTSEVELSSNRHSDLPNFAPPPGQEEFKKELVQIAQSTEVGRKITYRYGAPGTGKTRRVLEAVVNTAQLGGTTLYFQNPKDAKAFLKFAEQHRMSAFIIVDDYLDDSNDESRIGLEDIPDNVRCLLIGHGQNIRTKRHEALSFDPLGEEGLFALLKGRHPTLTEGAITQHIRDAGRNIRLANIFCTHLRNDYSNIDIFKLLLDIQKDKQNIRDLKVFICLSLVKFLKAEDRTTFCELSEIDEDHFKEECRISSTSNMLIQHNEHVSYISCNKLAYLTLIDTWAKSRRIIEHILGNPGQFRGQILERLKELPECDEKSEMLAFFKPAMGDLTLSSMANGMGHEFVQLMLATPEEYLPILVKCVLDAGEGIKEWLYEGERFGRRELIDPLKDLAQFAQYFEQCEAVLFQLVKYEIETPYVNDSTAAWCDWFRPYFDYTIYPYQERLSLLEKRIQDNPRTTIPKLAKIISNLFPHTGLGIPSRVVGGKEAPQRLHDQKLYLAPCRLAVEKYPNIITTALQDATDEERELLSNAVADGVLRWISFSGDTSGVLTIMQSPKFSNVARQKVEFTLKKIAALKDLRGKAREEQGRDLEESSTYYEKIDVILNAISRPDDLKELAFMLQDDFIFHTNEKLSHEAVELGKRISESEEVFRRAIDVFADKTSPGGRELAKLYCPLFSKKQRLEVLRVLAHSEGSQFLYAFVYECATNDHEFKDAALKTADSIKDENWVVALNLFDRLDLAASFKLQASLVGSGTLPVSVLGRTYLRDSNDVSEELWELIDIAHSKMLEGDLDAANACIHISGEFIRVGMIDDKVVGLALTALESASAARDTMADYVWQEVAEKLVESAPEKVIEIASRGELEEYSKSVQLLATLASNHGDRVLASLENRLANAYKAPYVLHGSLESIVDRIDPAVFQKWMARQPDSVLVNLAGHLPNPELTDGMPVIHPNTFAYWSQVRKNSPIFKEALDEFTAHTCSFGWTGYGVELFARHIDLANALITHELDGIRVWAVIFKASAEEHLRRAEKSKTMDQAREDTRG
ncbi:MAG: hypothetical protein JNM28_13290 [Armatimonadetes bacterium]|nr:hypothetical protein [Armatimonadota bacterium]